MINNKPAMKGTEMKKLIIITALIFTCISVCHADIKLTTVGIVVSEPCRNTGEGWNHSTGSILVNIQGEIYSVEDTKYNLIKNLKPGDHVVVCFELNEDDRVSKLYIIKQRGEL